MKHDLCDGRSSTQADLNVVVVHDLKRDSLGPWCAPAGVDLRRRKVDFEPETGTPRLALNPPAEMQWNAQRLGSFSQEEFAGAEDDFLKRLRVHPLVGIGVEDDNNINIRNIPQRGAPEDVMQSEVDRDTQVVEVHDRRCDSEPTALDLLSKLWTGEHLCGELRRDDEARTVGDRLSRHVNNALTVGSGFDQNRL